MTNVIRFLATLLLLASVCVVEPPAVAQGQVDPKSIVGREKNLHKLTMKVMPPLPENEGRALVAKLQVIRELLLETPALQTLQGYDWDTLTSVGTAETVSAPVVAFVSYRAFAHPLEGKSNKADSTGEGLQFSTHVNDPDAILGGSSGYQIDQQARITFEPKVTGQVDGFPVYEGDFVVLSPRGQPVFTPMSEQRFLDYEIDRTRKIERDARKDLEGLPEGPTKQRLVGRYRQRVQALEAELASLPVARRSAPARMPVDLRSTRRASLLSERPDPTDRLIVTLNPKLFDPTKPRSAVQLIIIGTPHALPEVYRQVWQQIDKKKLLSLID